MQGFYSSSTASYSNKVSQVTIGNISPKTVSTRLIYHNKFNNFFTEAFFMTKHLSAIAVIIIKINKYAIKLGSYVCNVHAKLVIVQIC